MTLSVNIQEAANLIATCGTSVTCLIRGVPGIGKSTILKLLAGRLPDYLPCYIDMSTVDLGDLAMPIVDREAMVTNFAPNARFGLARNQKRPVIIMLDELTKASKPVMNMTLPLMLERRLGDRQLPEGSIVFATGNLASDGVGDALQAHTANRLTVVDMRPPSVDEWINWGMSNDISPEVLAFVKQYPQCLDVYTDCDTDNPYIFNPLKGRVAAFTSPRSLAKASDLIRHRDILGDALLPALAGTIGESAARDMEALIALADSVPSFESVVRDPASCRLPDGVGASFLMSFLLAGRVTPETLDAVMTYAARWQSFEALALLISTLASNSKKVAFCVKNREFTRQCSVLGAFF